MCMAEGMIIGIRNQIPISPLLLAVKEEFGIMRSSPALSSWKSAHSVRWGWQSPDCSLWPRKCTRDSNQIQWGLIISWLSGLEPTIIRMSQTPVKWGDNQPIFISGWDSLRSGSRPGLSRPSWQSRDCQPPPPAALERLPVHGGSESPGWEEPKGFCHSRL